MLLCCKMQKCLSIGQGSMHICLCIPVWGAAFSADYWLLFRFLWVFYILICMHTPPPPTLEYPLLPSSQRLMTAAPGGRGLKGLSQGQEERGGCIQSVSIVKWEHQWWKWGIFIWFGRLYLVWKTEGEEWCQRDWVQKFTQQCVIITFPICMLSFNCIICIAKRW